MKILITGASGFIAKNLIAELESTLNTEIFKVGRDTKNDQFEYFCKKADFVFHLAGENRPKDDADFMKGNYEFTKKLLNTLKKNNNRCPIIFSSSIQADSNNSYGESKKAGEELIIDHKKETGARISIYRLPNVFGKWSKPNYNSVIATFCYKISRDIPIEINNKNTELRLVYIDEVIKELISSLHNNKDTDEDFYEVKKEYLVKLGDVADYLYSFKESREFRRIPNMEDPLIKRLYSTYLSYLPKNQFSYNLKMNKDDRGSFTEFIKTIDRGQVSVNVSKPGITKGNHWHHTKNEKFLVVSGKGVIRFREFDSDEVIEYLVSGDHLEVVDIPPGYTHNIENLCDYDMVTIMWANEEFDPQNADTKYLEV